MNRIRESYGFSPVIHEVSSTEAELEAMIFKDSELDSDSDSYSDTDSDTDSVTYSDTDDEYTFVQDCRSAAGLDLTQCVLLDSESTVHAFCNRDLVSNIYHVEKPMNLVSNGGQITTNMRCHINNLSMDQPVWFHPKYITNVLSLALLRRQFRITYNSSKGGALVVHKPGNAQHVFSLLF